MSDNSTLDTNKQKNHYVHVVVFLLCIFISFGLLFYSKFTESPPMPLETEKQLETDSFTMRAATPSVLRIPAIDLETQFSEPLGLNEDQSVSVPESYDSVGWYRFGPTPGELGPAVVLGHVDSYEGPAVFFSLGQLTTGDKIFVDREDGTTATFTVTHLERPEQTDFPTALVYSDLAYAGLRLITCTGTYNRGIERYSHNLIVFAKLTE